MFSQPLTPNNGPAYPLPSRSQLSQDDPPSKIRVLLVDDHTMLRQALRSIVDGCANMEVVGEATNGLEAIETVTRVRPDVVVMDVNMPKMNGVELPSTLRRCFHRRLSSGSLSRTRWKSGGRCKLPGSARI